jgi:hypothetical protein
MQNVELKVKKVSDLPNFPYKNFEEFKVAVTKGEVGISVAMDISRQWLTNHGKYSSSGDRTKAIIYMFIPYIFALFLLIYSVASLKFLFLLLLLPLVYSLFTMTPVTLRIFGLNKLIIIVAVALFFYSFIFTSSTGLLLLSLTFLIPWLAHKFLYDLSAKAAREAIFQHEDLFLLFVKAKAVSAYYPTTNETIWFDKDWSELKKAQDKK